MEIIIDKTKLEKVIPAFANPDSQIFDLIYSYIESEADKVSAYIGQCSKASLTAAEHLVCFRAARRALPQLDIVMTPNGIGVVRNNEIAPASKERVDAFKENLRQQASLWQDDLTISMSKDLAWCQSPQAEEVISSLIWCPFVARHYGMTTTDGKEIYQEEFTALQPAIYMAEARIANIISHDLLDALVKFEREHMAKDDKSEQYKLYGKAMVRTKRLLSAIVMNKDEAVTRELANSLLEFVQAHEDSLPEYKNSSLRKSKDILYENKKESPCFFFG